MKQSNHCGHIMIISLSQLFISEGEGGGREWRIQRINLVKKLFGSCGKGKSPITLYLSQGSSPCGRKLEIAGGRAVSRKTIRLPFYDTLPILNPPSTRIKVVFYPKFCLNIISSGMSLPEKEKIQKQWDLIFRWTVNDKIQSQLYQKYYKESIYVWNRSY